MSKPAEGKVRMNVTIDKEFHAWMVETAGDMGISLAGFTNVLLREARASREQKELMAGYLRQMQSLTPEQMKIVMDKAVADTGGLDKLPE